MQTLLVAVVLLFALVSRLEGLRQPFDDVFGWRQASTAMMAQNLPKNGWNPFWPEVDWTGNAPGYQGREFQTLTYFAALADVAFGRRHWHGRAVAVIFGLITTISVLGLVTVLRGRREGVAAAALYAVSPGAVMVDRSYLPDPAMVAILAASLWALAAGLKTRNAAILMVAAVLGILGILAKPTAVAAIPAAMVLVACARDAAQPARRALLLGVWLLFAAAIAGGYFAWIVHLGLSSPSGHVAGHWHVPWTDQAANAFYVHRLSWLARNWLWTPVILLLVFVGIIVLIFDRGQPGARFLLVWLMSSAILYAAIASEFVNNPWNLHVLDPLVAAIGGAGLIRIVSISGGRTAVPAAVVILFSIAVEARENVFDMKFGYPYTAERLMGEKLGELAGPADLVIVASGFAGNPLPIYHSGRKGWTFPHKGHTADYMAGHGEPLEVLAWMRRNGARWFGVIRGARDTYGRRFVDHHADLLRHLQSYPVAYSDDIFVIYRLDPP